MAGILAAPAGFLLPGQETPAALEPETPAVEAPKPIPDSLSKRDRELVEQIRELRAQIARLRQEVEKNDTHLLSIRSLEMAGEIQEAAHKLRSKVGR